MKLDLKHADDLDLEKNQLNYMKDMYRKSRESVIAQIKEAQSTGGTFLSYNGSGLSTEFVEELKSLDYVVNYNLTSGYFIRWGKDRHESVLLRQT